MIQELIRDCYYDDDYGCYQGFHKLVDCRDPKCSRRDHSCECGDCCDACWFMCCASRRAIDTQLERLLSSATPVSRCGSVSLAELDDVINETGEPDHLDRKW